MWQDALVTIVAAGAVAVLGRRWLGARASASGSCPSCASGAACGAADPDPRGAEASQGAVSKPLVLVRKEEMGRERFGPGGDYRF